MGTLTVDNLITTLSDSTVRDSNVGMILLNKTVCSGTAEIVYNSTTLQTSVYENYKLIINNLERVAL